jgi:Protein of unknown function (DUF1761)
MGDVNVVAVVVAAVAAFAFAGAYYSVLAGRLATLGPAWADRGSTPAWPSMAFELVKGALIALVIAALIDRLAVVGVIGGLALALVLWVAFPVMLLAGSVIHERVPTALAAIHAGDWLAKLVIIALIVTIWP